jgi:hypothetical protein
MSAPATRTKWTSESVTHTDARLLLGRDEDGASMSSWIEKSLLALDSNSSQCVVAESSPSTIEADEAEPANTEVSNLDAAQTLIKEYLVGNPVESEKERIYNSPVSRYGAKFRYIRAESQRGRSNRAAPPGKSCWIRKLLGLLEGLHRSENPLIRRKCTSTTTGPTTKLSNLSCTRCFSRLPSNGGRVWRKRIFSRYK